MEVQRELPRAVTEQGKSKEFGYNVIHTVRVLRHPEKNSMDGNLTPKGERDSSKMGELYSRWKKRYDDKVEFERIAHSGRKRPKRAAELIKKEFAASSENIVNASEDKNLDYRSSSTFDQAYADAVRDAYPEGKINFDKEGAGVQIVVDTNDVPFDEESASSKESSQNIAQSLLDLVNDMKNSRSNTHKRSIFLSHSAVIENFIVDMLELRSEQDSVSKIGGGAGFLEGFEFRIEQLDPDNIQIKVRFETPNYSKYSEAERERLKKLYDISLTKEKLEQLAGANKPKLKTV